MIELPPEPETTAHERALAKARRDVRRFGLAIEQCTKGEARLAVLRADLTRAERRLTMLSFDTSTSSALRMSGEKI